MMERESQKVALAPSLTSSRPAEPAPKSPTSAFRWVVCGLLFAVSANNYLDRQAFGVLAPALIDQWGWSPEQYAAVVFWFQLGFAVGFPLTGLFLDRVGTRWGYAIIVSVWSVASGINGVVASVLPMKLARFAFGVSQAGNMPAGVKAVGELFAPGERALAMGIFKAGSNIGAMLAPLWVPWLYLKCGWHVTFWVVGASGLLWVAIWLGVCRVSKSPQSVEPKAASCDVRWSWLLKRRETWGYVNFKFMTDAIWHWYLAMLPLFLHQRYGLTLSEFGLPLVLVYSIGCVGSVGGGWLSSHWIARGWGITRARKVAMFICCVSTVPVMLVTQLSDMWLCVTLIGVAHAAHQGLTSNLFAAVSDIFPKQAVGRVIGLGGFAAQIGAALMTLASGVLLQTQHHLAGVFFVAGSAYVVAFVIFHFLVPSLSPVSEGGGRSFNNVN